MNTRRRIWISSASLVVALGLLSTVVCRAQPAPDPSLWNPVFNPNGQRVVPVVFYNPATGILGVDTRGLNRLDDTPDYTTQGGPIGFDDVGLIALTFFTPIAGGTVLPPFNMLFDPIQFLSWNSQYDGGRYRINGNPLANQFLWPGVYSVIQLPPNLTSNEFGSVEAAVNFGPGVPGQVLFAQSNGVQIVPEPTIVSLLITTALCLIFRGPGYFGRHRRPVHDEGTMLCRHK